MDIKINQTMDTVEAYEVVVLTAEIPKESFYWRITISESKIEELGKEARDKIEKRLDYKSDLYEFIANKMKFRKPKGVSFDPKMMKAAEFVIKAIYTQLEDVLEIKNLKPAQKTVKESLSEEKKKNKKPRGKKK